LCLQPEPYPWPYGMAVLGLNSSNSSLPMCLAYI
jgi:hypothetical protein